MAAGNKHLGYKEALNAIEARLARREGRVLPRLRRAHGAAARRARGRGRRRAAARARRAARRRPARCARSAAWSTEWRPPTDRSPRRSCVAGRGADDAREPPFDVGDRVLLLDAKQRRYLVTLAEGGEFHSHAGFVPHADLVGQPEGVVVRSTTGATYTVLRPTLEDFVLEMPRGAQVIYPEGPRPDLHAGRHRPRRARVRERRRVGCAVDDDAALGRRRSSATSSARTSPTAPEANVRSVPRRGRAGALPRRAARLLRGHRRAPDRSTGSCSTCPSRGRSCRTPRRRCAAGGILVAYTPSIMQAAQLREALATGAGSTRRTLEVLHRGWHVDGQAVRPDHRMVAHTGFLTAARSSADGVGRRGERSAETPSEGGPGRPPP